MIVCSIVGQAFGCQPNARRQIDGNEVSYRKPAADCYFAGTIAVWRRRFRCAAMNSGRVPHNGTVISRGRINVDSVNR